MAHLSSCSGILPPKLLALFSGSMLNYNTRTRKQADGDTDLHTECLDQLGCRNGSKGNPEGPTA